MTRQELLEGALSAVTGQRAHDYGTVEDNFKRIAGYWSIHLGHPVSAHDVAAMMALLKIARIGNSPGLPDSWLDLAGYAACGAEIACD